MNVEHFRKTRDRIADEANPTGFNMQAWLSLERKPGEIKWDNLPTSGYGQCGTVACIAGHAVNGNWPEPLPNIKIGVEAQRLLGISDDEADYIFYGQWAQPKTMASITKEEAIAYLDECIKAGEVVIR